MTRQTGSLLLRVAGLCVCIFGWSGCIVAALLQAPFLQFGQSGLTMSQRDLMTLSQSMLFTGLALLLVSTMQRGFGALDRFFDAAIRRVQAQSAGDAIAEVPAPRPVPTPVQQAAAALSERRLINGRVCVERPDGTVEVDTLLGPRRFCSVTEAEDFVGSVMPPPVRQQARLNA